MNATLKFQKNWKTKGNCYGNLGLVYYDLEDLKTAIGYFKFHLNISRELGNLSGEGRAYGNLGNS